MNANERRYEDDFLFKEETYQVIGSAIEIINTIGNGFFEKIYENALVAEFDLRKIPYRQQSRYAVLYKGKTLGEYIPDLVAYDGIIIEIKTIDRITPQERGQVLNYLRVTGFKVGTILNFKNAKLEWERVALSGA